ncbi:MAG: hypothetical protein V2J51_13940 [Erythrobacter sp.]|jgi:hypothetical protein|nr:hypothetical protein [Erythrobacter sp.]
MFEKNPPVPPRREGDAENRSSPARNVLIGASRRAKAGDEPGGGGDALRMIGWSELTARLNATRDLREVLTRDMRGDFQAETERFADAAARYFRERESSDDARRINGGPGVNRVGSQAGNGSCANNRNNDGNGEGSAAPDTMRDMG